MTGNPMARLLAVAALLALAGVVVVQVTTGAPRLRPGGDNTAQAEERRLEIVLRFVPPPEAFTVEHTGNVLVESQGAMDEVRAEERFSFAFPMPAAGIDLVVRVRWPAGVGYGACRVVAALDGTVRADETLWGGGGRAAEGVVTVRE